MPTGLRIGQAYVDKVKLYHGPDVIKENEQHTMVEWEDDFISPLYKTDVTQAVNGRPKRVSRQPVRYGFDA